MYTYWAVLLAAGQAMCMLAAGPRSPGCLSWRAIHGRHACWVHSEQHRIKARGCWTHSTLCFSAGGSGMHLPQLGIPWQHQLLTVW